MKALIDIFEKSGFFSEEALHDFISVWETVSISKGELLSVEGKTDRYLYFTETGIQKAYYLNNGTPEIVSFTKPSHFSCAPESFLTQCPSKYYFETIVESKMYRISYANFSFMVEKHKEVKQYLMNALLNLINTITERFIKQRTMPIKDRFKDFMHNDAELINTIPHKDIANYLNINPTNFSKLLNNVQI